MDNPSLSFYHPGSIAYEGSDQLVELGLLREDQGWRQIRAIVDDREGEVAPEYSRGER